MQASPPETTDVVVMTAKVAVRGGETGTLGLDLDTYDQQLMTAVVERAERVGKKVRPLIVPTNSPLHAILQVAKAIQAQEVVVGASNKFTAEEQLDQIASYLKDRRSCSISFADVISLAEIAAQSLRTFFVTLYSTVYKELQEIAVYIESMKGEISGLQTNRPLPWRERSHLEVATWLEPGRWHFGWKI